MFYCLFYGSLCKYSKRGYNFNRFKDIGGEQIYIKDAILDGYELFNLGQYPAAAIGNGQIKAELHSISDIYYTLVANMEINSGYKETFVKLDGGIVASLFVMDKENLVNMPKIKSGNWD